MARLAAATPARAGGLGSAEDLLGEERDREAKTLMGVIAKNRRAYQRTAAIYGRSGLTAALFGLLFLGFGIVEQQYLDRMAVFFDAAGLIILLSAGFAYYNRRKINKA